MPNSESHFRCGAASGAAVMGLRGLLAQIKNRRDSGNHGIDLRMLTAEVAYGAAIGGFAGVLPDVLEPAGGPWHRGSFHSRATGCLLAYICLRENSRNGAIGRTKLVAGVVAGYLSHLWEDSQTPAGLPLI